MKFNDIYTASCSEGLGMRVVLFVSGCHHHCKGCFNRQTWDPNFGQDFTEETEDYLIDKINKPYIRGLSLCGGEPFYMSNREPLLHLCERVRKECPGKDIWSYTGAEFEDLLLCGKEYSESGYKLLSCIDVLVAGPFILEQRDVSLPFRGSKNQYILDVKKSLCTNHRVLVPC